MTGPPSDHLGYERDLCGVVAALTDQGEHVVVVTGDPHVRAALEERLGDRYSVFGDLASVERLERVELHAIGRRYERSGIAAIRTLREPMAVRFINSADVGAQVGNGVLCVVSGACADA